MINNFLNHMKNRYCKNKLQIKSFFSAIRFFFIRDFMFVVKNFNFEIIVANLVIHISLERFQSAFSFIYRASILINMLSVVLLYVILATKSSKTNKFTDSQKSEINSESLTRTWSKRNQMVIKILSIVIPYFIQLYFQLNFKLFNVEPILAATSDKTIQGCFMFLFAALLTYFTYQSQLFRIAYERNMC